MSRSSTLSLAAAVIAFVVRAGSASAEPRPTMTLDYVVADGAEGCPAKEGVQARLAAEVGYDPIVESSPTFTTTFEVAPTPTGVSGRYTSSRARPAPADAPSVRELSAETCDELVSSFVLAAAISLDPEIAPREPPPRTPDPKIVAVPVPVFVDRPVVLPVEQPHRPPRVHFVLHAGYTVGGGVVPGVDHGPVAYVGVRTSALEVGVEGSYLFEGNETSGVGDVLVSAAFASVVPCYAPALIARLRFFACGHVALGGAFIDAARVTTPSPTTLPLAMLGGRVGIGVWIAAPLEVRFLGDLLATLTPFDADIRDHGARRRVFTSSPVAGRGVLALSLAFP